MSMRMGNLSKALLILRLGELRQAIEMRRLKGDSAT
jgi:hypothetical protein